MKREQRLLQKGLNISLTTENCSVVCCVFFLKKKKNPLHPLQNQKGQIPTVQNNYLSILNTNYEMNFTDKQI